MNDVTRVRVGRPRRCAAVSSPVPSRKSIRLHGVMDEDGRVDESRLRKYIFLNGGVLPQERTPVWQFLFGMYPSRSTAMERPRIQEQMVVRYQVMKQKWQHICPGAVHLQLNGTDGEIVAAVDFFRHRQSLIQEEVSRLPREARERKSFLELQTEILLKRVDINLEELQEAIRIIDKDVPRTDRDLNYYLGEGLGNLLVLRDILITYAAFHPDVSYAQGMNDICSRFLVVLDSEVDTFWSFSCYMKTFSKDFHVDGLHRKIELEAALLKELDPLLHRHLVTDSMDRFTFCHRWLLLGFQREFEHSEALRLFEILRCDHLELISQQVERARYQERIIQNQTAEDKPRIEPLLMKTEYTFELFICASIILENREKLLNCRNDVQLIQFTSSLQGTLDLNSTLKKAEEHFFNYCKCSTWGYLNSRYHSHRSKDHFLNQIRNLFT
ncbi:TBC1 domain family member 15 [Engraulis encrasicolus]|uniref:TBC1 domain family member 15 n=1 Tax=Engraulis encrasicolus TaxID=184585 RepID=UPI002FD07B02